MNDSKTAAKLRAQKPKTAFITGGIALLIGASLGFSVGYEWGREDERSQ